MSLPFRALVRGSFIADLYLEWGKQSPKQCRRLSNYDKCQTNKRNMRLPTFGKKGDNIACIGGAIRKL